MSRHDRADKAWLRPKRSIWPTAVDLIGTMLIFAAVVGVFAMVLLEWLA